MSISHVLLSSSFFAACLAAGANALSIRRASKERERDRLRNTLADAFRAYSDYKEFPYAIRRRSANDPSAERQRLSEELREIQSRLSYFSTWLIAESEEIGTVYSNLLQKLRSIAGDSMRTAWLEAPLTSDSEMNIGQDKVNLTELKVYEDAFLSVIRNRIQVKD